MERPICYSRFRFQRLEKCGKTLPTIGNNTPSCSNDWKPAGKRFQRLGKRARSFPSIGILLANAFLLAALNVSSASAEPPPSGPELMQRVRAALPDAPVYVEGELQSRDRRGNIMRVTPVAITFDWGAAVPRAEYVVRDRFGSERERLRIAWPPDEPVRFTLMAGDPPEPQPVEDLNRRINGLDLYWTDLSLSFLWWTGAKRTGSERIRGRFCYRVDIPAPPDAADGISGVRLWIDPEVHLMMQADAYDADGAPLRRVQVKSLKKINDVWMVQNLDLYNLRTRERVTLRVRDVEALEAR